MRDVGDLTRVSVRQCASHPFPLPPFPYPDPAQSLEFITHWELGCDVDLGCEFTVEILTWYAN